MSTGKSDAAQEEGACLLVDAEIAGRLDRRFLLFDSADVGPSRTAVKERREFLQLIGWTGGVDFDTSVVEIPGVPRKTQRLCRFLREIAVSDALHTAADEPAPRLDASGCHCENYSVTAFDSISPRIVARNSTTAFTP